jgi:spiro-SPASM protein
MDILLFIDEGITDEHLTFRETYLPDQMENLVGSLNAKNLYYSIHQSYKGRLNNNSNAIKRSGCDNNQFWKELLEKTGSDHVIKIYADSPFLDTGIIREMCDLHTEYMAEYTFSENLPTGLSCEIISGELIKALPYTEKDTLSLGSVIKSNINQFDIEIYYRDPDIRDKRLSFRSGCKRNRAVMENIFDCENSVPEYNDLRKLINENPGVLYTGPSYLEIELTGACDLKCIFCYRESIEKEHGHLPISLLEKTVNEMREFSLPYTLCFGGSGEPLMHPEFYRAAELVLKEEIVEKLIVETNGILANANYWKFAEENNSRLTTIININGLDSETYTNLHGSDHFQIVLKNIEELKKREKDTDNLFIQVMKINETEPFLDRYYDFWEEKKVKIILQKQNVYLGRIKDRRYSDLSPIVRTPCWHLQRDLYIHSDGKVGFCKQDIDEGITGTHLSEKKLPEIWKLREDAFKNDYNQIYPGKPDCSQCDEWYTFNF